MTFEQLDAVCVIMKWFGIATAMWFSGMVVDVFTLHRNNRVLYAFRFGFTWYSRIFMATIIIVGLFILALLWETRSY